MANAKFIDATTWGNLTEVDVTDGENLFPQLPAGTYRPVLSGVDSVTVPALSAGTIDQATPTEGDTLTVSGSNATGSATYQWQKGGVDISGATSASLDTTGEGAGDFRRGVSDGVQGPVYTSAVTVSAASSGFTDTFDYTGNLEDQSKWTPIGTGLNDKPEADGSDAFLDTAINSEWFMEANQDLADNQYCEVTITDVGSGFGNQYNLFVRATDRDNFYCVEIRENTIKDIDSYSGGVKTELASNDTVISNGDVVRLAASGTSITVTVNGGAPIMTGTSSANTSGRAGIWFDFVGASQTTSTKIGLFEAGDL